MSIGALFSISPVSAVAASRKPNLYIKVAVTETKTTVGQQPKIVVTYGNNGDQRYDTFEGQCYDNTGKLDITLRNFEFHDLIPGQYDNTTFTAYARSTGNAYVQCEIVAYYSNASGRQEVYRQSNTVKVVIKPAN